MHFFYSFFSGRSRTKPAFLRGVAGGCTGRGCSTGVPCQHADTYRGLNLGLILTPFHSQVCMFPQSPSIAAGGADSALSFALFCGSCTACFSSDFCYRIQQHWSFNAPKGWSIWLLFPSQKRHVYKQKRNFLLKQTASFQTFRRKFCWVTWTAL